MPFPGNQIYPVKKCEKYHLERSGTFFPSCLSPENETGIPQFEILYFLKERISWKLRIQQETENFSGFGFYRIKPTFAWAFGFIHMKFGTLCLVDGFIVNSTWKPKNCVI